MAKELEVKIDKPGLYLIGTIVSIQERKMKDETPFHTIRILCGDQIYLLSLFSSAEAYKVGENYTFRSTVRAFKHGDGSVGVSFNFREN